MLMLAWCPAGSVLAQEPPPAEEPEHAGLVVLVYREGDPLGVRLEAELRSIGMRVVARRHAGALPEGTIAVATLTEGPERRVELRMGNHPSPDSEPDSAVAIDVEDDLAVIHASEQLRAAFAPLASHAAPVAPAIPAPQPPSVTAAQPWLAPDPSPPAQLETQVAVAREPAVHHDAQLPSALRPPPLPALRPFHMGVGLGLGQSIGVEGSTLEALASVFFRPVRWLRVEPFVAIPLLPITFEDRAGSADLFAGSTGARVAFETWRSPAASLLLGASIAGVWLRVEGDAKQGYAGTTEDVFTASATVDLRFRLRLAGPLWLAPRASIGLSLAPVDVVFDQQVVGTWGLPVGSLELPVEIEWELR